VQLVVGDVGVTADGGEIGVAEVCGDEPGIAGLLAEPGRRGVAERVGSDALLDRGLLGGAADDRGEDRRLQPLSLESAEDGRVAGRLPVGAEERELVCERGRERLAAWLAALPQRTSNDGRGPSSSRSDQSSAISSARRRPVWTSVSTTSRSRAARPAR
jgi:hypothetical protein